MCGCDTWHLCGLKMAGLDNFLLEDDDCSQLFITQEPKSNDSGDKMEVDDDDLDTFLGVNSNNFGAPP